MSVLQPETLLDGRYKIIRSLAEGGFGHTYIAEDIRRPASPQCVVKQLKPASRTSSHLNVARRLFNTEAETLERLGEHDQIPRLLAFFEENQEFYIVQDFIAGNTLAAELNPGQFWSESQLCLMLEDVLKVLTFVHEQRVIHRDIKPDNLIRRTKDKKLVLVDFGTVKRVRSDVNSEHLTSATVAIGTQGYMPTEQAQGTPRLNSDIYALGLIGIQAATGLSLDQIRTDSKTGELLWKPWSQFSEQLTDILEKMVRYHFKDRYQSASEVVADIETYLQATKPSEVDSTQPIFIDTSGQQPPVGYPPPQPTTVSGPSPGDYSQPQPTTVSGQPQPPVGYPPSQPTTVSGQPPPPVGYPPSQPTTVSGQPPPPVGYSQPQPTTVSGQQPPVGYPPPQPTTVSGQPPPPVGYSQPQPTTVSGQQPPVGYPPPQPTTVSGQPPPVDHLPPQPTTTTKSNWTQEASNRIRQWPLVDSLYQALLTGSGSWLLAISLFSLIGTLWLSTIFWLVFVLLIVFAVFAKRYHLPEKILLTATAVLSTGSALLIFPRNIQLSSIFDSVWYGLGVSLLLAIFSGAIAFIVLVVSQSFSE